MSELLVLVGLGLLIVTMYLQSGKWLQSEKVVNNQALYMAIKKSRKFANPFKRDLKVLIVNKYAKGELDKETYQKLYRAAVALEKQSKQQEYERDYKKFYERYNKAHPEIVTLQPDEERLQQSIVTSQGEDQGYNEVNNGNVELQQSIVTSQPEIVTLQSGLRGYNEVNNGNARLQQSIVTSQENCKSYNNQAKPIVNLQSGGQGLQQPEVGKWWSVVTKEVIHLLLVGETNSGKTSVARALFKERATIGKVMVLDPHATPDRWGKIDYVIGAGNNYEAIDNAMKWLLEELKSRYEARAKGDLNQEPFTVFIDEFNSIADECVNSKMFIKRVSRGGREAGIRLVILGQSNRVRSLNIEGEGDIRENFSLLLLGSKAREVKQFPDSVLFPAVFDHKGVANVVNTEFVPSYDAIGVREASIVKPYGEVVPTTDEEAHSNLLVLTKQEQERQERDLKVLKWKLTEPETSVRELARRLYPDTDGGGGYSIIVKESLDRLSNQGLLEC